jgi:hypothetical protein
MEDAGGTYMDTFGVQIPGVTNRLGQAKAGPEISYTYLLSGDTKIEPHAGTQVIWNFAGNTIANGLGPINGEPAGPPGIRGRVDFGVRATTMRGVALDFSGSYDGIGSRGYEALGGKVLLRMPLN